MSDKISKDEETIDSTNTDPKYWDRVLLRNPGDYSIVNEADIDGDVLPLEAAGLDPDDVSAKIFNALARTGGSDIDFAKPTSWAIFYKNVYEAINELAREQGSYDNICLGLRISCQAGTVVVTVYASQSGGLRRHINTMNLGCCNMRNVARRLEQRFPQYPVRYIDNNNYTLR